MKKPDAVVLSKRNHLRPFEDPRDLEFFCQKNQSAFIIISSHSKKRPHNIVMARMYDHQLLDMIEWGVEDLQVMEQFQVQSFDLFYRQSKHRLDPNLF